MGGEDLYTDPDAGWSVTVPPPLHARPFNATGRISTSGASVSNFASEAVPNQDGLASLRSFPSTGAMFMLWRNEGGVVGVNTTDDTPLPLSLSDYRISGPYVGGAEPHPLSLSVIEGGGWFASAVWIGAEASEVDRRAIEEVVASVTFPSLRPISVSPTSNAIVLDEVSKYPVGSVTPFTQATLQPAAPTISDFGSPLSAIGLYLVHGTNGFFALPMRAQTQTGRTCKVAADLKTVTFSCTNGAEWDRYVRATHPPADQDGTTGYWLFVAPVTVSWDGFALVNEGNAPEAAQAAWNGH